MTIYPSLNKSLKKNLHKIVDSTLSNPSTVFSKSLSAFVNHLFVEPISEDDKPHLIVPMAIKLAEFYAGCLQSFKRI